MPRPKKKKDEGLKEEMAEKFEELQTKVNQLFDKQEKHAGSYPLAQRETTEDLKQRMRQLEEQLGDKTDTKEVQNEQENEDVKELSSEDPDSDGSTIDMESYVGHYKATKGSTNWRVSGYSSVSPSSDFNYFAGLDLEGAEVKSRLSYEQNKTISLFIPCCTEERKDLERTLLSLHRQSIPKSWRVEVILVVDGVDTLDSTMCEKLEEIFGISLNRGDEKDPFVKFPEAQVVIVDPATAEDAYSRKPVVHGTVGGCALLVKRQNRRLKNSQMWWLGSHGSSIQCKYAVTTQCGTAFSRKSLSYFVRRLVEDHELLAVYGLQRLMTSNMQGKGHYEFIQNPGSSMLRMLQRFQLEMDHAITHPLCDTFGRMMHAKTGMIRYDSLGTLTEGLMKDYFDQPQGSSRGLVMGNIDMIEDQTLGVFLSFPRKKHLVNSGLEDEDSPRTGYVPEAVVYTEAETQLSQLVKQQRRQRNGDVAMNMWLLNEAILTYSAQSSLRFLSNWVLTFLSVLQSIVIRCCGPAVLIVSVFRFGLFLPDIFRDLESLFEADLVVESLEIVDGQLPFGIVCGVAYAWLFVHFVFGHATYVNERKESKQAYRSWLIKPAVVVNAAFTLVVLMNTIGVLIMYGWSGTPVYTQLLLCLCLAPLVLGAVAGLIQRDLRNFGGMLLSLPGAILLFPFYWIWVPCYATARMSDLTWGNREGGTMDHGTSTKLATYSRRLVYVLVLLNLLIACSVIVAMTFFEDTYPIFVLCFASFFAISPAVTLFDLIRRLVTCQYCFSSTVEEDEFFAFNCIQDYHEMETDIVGANKCGKWNGSDTSDDSDYLKMEDVERAIIQPPSFRASMESEKHKTDPSDPQDPLPPPSRAVSELSQYDGMRRGLLKSEDEQDVTMAERLKRIRTL